MKRILVRRTVEEDISAINENVRWNPRVREQQYRRVTMLDSEALCKHLLDNPDFGFMSWTIFDGDSIVGHVLGNQKMVRGKNCFIAGWNLHPEYWGRGIMTQSLVQVFGELFENGTEVIVADRFEQNDRCGRLLNRFSFQETDSGNFERIKIWIVQSCPHRIVRSLLDRETWNANVDSLKDNTCSEL